ncbi:divalent-cation tolerance protein CutA [Planomonospora sp. ID67723]|uniref:divalent-cation tolerance protein CutA n=1 Tax=Planomonospora sp. ID67723 TaxID=2738134 RepID=UPI0018C361FC|nr:divalent-cation tolerance protein CutA [Planomonospora sp. ID67723]MBG0827316.1 divalent-cation tolerance protein CutA [Planomonospora sp. ID67723]
MNPYLEVHVTAGSREEAEEIGAVAVRERVAACAQIVGPVSSVYRWKGEVRRDEEFLILMKTSKDRLDELVSAVKAAHSYETPEIVAVPIEGGSADYLHWIGTETAEPRQAG